MWKNRSWRECFGSSRVFPTYYVLYNKSNILICTKVVAFKLRSSFPLEISDELLPSHPYDYLVIDNEKHPIVDTEMKNLNECNGHNDIIPNIKTSNQSKYI